MRKYWLIFKTNLEKSLEYRAELFAHLIMGAFTLVIMIFIFKAVFKQTDNFAGYTFSSMLTYLVMVRVLHVTNRWNTSRLIGDEIKEGSLSMYLTRPVSYLRYWFSLFLADRFFEFLVRSSLILAFLVLVPTLFTFPSAGKLIVFFAFLPLALFLNFVFNLLLALLAFWVTDVRLFSTFVDLLVGFLAGSLVPLEMFPAAVRNISYFLPFQYTLYFPIKIYQGSLGPSQIATGVFVSLLWIGFLLVVLNYLWNKGLKRYEATGQ